MPQDSPVLAVRYKGNISHGDMTINISGEDKLQFRSPLFMMAGRAGSYDGKEGFNVEPDKLKLSFGRTSDAIVRFIEFDVQQKNDGTITALSAAGSPTIIADATVAPLLRELEVLWFPVEGLRVRIMTIAGTTLTVERLVNTRDPANASVTPAGVIQSSDIALPSGAAFVNLGRAVANLSTSLSERRYNAPTERTAALQINRADITISRRRKVQEKNDRTKHTMFDARQKQELFYTIRDLEKNFMFGAMTRDSLGQVNATGFSYSTNAVDSEKYSTSDGVINVIETYAPGNVLNAAAIGATGAGVIDMDLASKYMKFITDKLGMSDHIHLCSSSVFAKVGAAAQNIPGISYNIPFAETTVDKTTGHHIKTLQTQFGPMTFHVYPLFNEVAGFQNKIVSVRKERMELLALEGGELQWTGGTEENDLDGQRSKLIADFGLVFAYAQEHFILEDLIIV